LLPHVRDSALFANNNKINLKKLQEVSLEQPATNAGSDRAVIITWLDLSTNYFGLHCEAYALGNNCIYLQMRSWSEVTSGYDADAAARRCAHPA